MSIKQRPLHERREALSTMIGAREIVRDEWVCRGPVVEGEACALTAINRAAGVAQSYKDDKPRGSLAECMVLERVNKVHKPGVWDAQDDEGGWYNIPEWNDSDTRTKRQVTSVFGWVIKMLYNSLPAKERTKYKKLVEPKRK